GLEQLERVGRNAQDQIRMERRHHMKAGELRAALGLLARGLKVLAVLNELGAKRLHRAVLLDGVAARNVDHRGHAMTARGKGQALAVIAARRRDDTRRVRPLALETVKIDQ